MKSSFKLTFNVSKDWGFWFDHTKKLPKKSDDDSQKESYCFIVNAKTDELDYVSNSVKSVLGYHPSEFTLEHLFSIIHPDDLEYCRTCEYESLQVSNTLYYQEHFRCSFHYSYRIKAKNGKYVTIQQQYQTIEFNEYGHMLKTIVIHQKIDDYEERPIDDFKIFDKSKNRSINAVNRFNLTKRELEILELVQRGYNSTEISEKLFLSKLTVDTHRKNILNKTKSSSILDLIDKTGVYKKV